MNTKQVIIVRKDLKMKPGKLAAQVAHASIGAVLERFDSNFDVEHSAYNLSVQLQDFDPLLHWLQESFTKVILKVNSEEELLAIYEVVKTHGLPCTLIKDDGRTVFQEPTFTCVGVGPARVERIDELVEHLKLY